MADRRSRGRLVAAVIAATVGFSPAAWTQDETAAPGAAKVLDILAKALDIVPKVLDIEGVALGVEGILADLDAKVTDVEIKIALPGDILFDFDKDTLRPDALPTLQKIADVLANYPDAPVLIEGFTDSKGKDSYNLKLSDRRAASVKKWLVENAGVDGDHINTKGWGEAKPVTPNIDPEGRQKNRRVEITIKTG
jgi:outer membrane protein OmpA-like peptidoglycan-associated protein